MYLQTVNKRDTLIKGGKKKKKQIKEYKKKREDRAVLVVDV
jgi:hypothetical protein